MTSRKFFLLVLTFVVLGSLATVNAKPRRQATHNQIVGSVSAAAKKTQAVVTQQAEATQQVVAEGNANISAQVATAQQETANSQEALAKQVSVEATKAADFRTFVYWAVFVVTLFIAIVVLTIGTCVIYYAKYGQMPAINIKGFTQETISNGYEIHKELSNGIKIGHIKKEKRDQLGNASGFIVIYPPKRRLGIFMVPGRIERVARHGLVPDYAAQGAWRAGMYGWEFSHRLLQQAA